MPCCSADSDCTVRHTLYVGEKGSIVDSRDRNREQEQEQRSDSDSDSDSGKAKGKRSLSVEGLLQTMYLNNGRDQRLAVFCVCNAKDKRVFLLCILDAIEIYILCLYVFAAIPNSKATHNFHSTGTHTSSGQAKIRKLAERSLQIIIKSVKGATI